MKLLKYILILFMLILLIPELSISAIIFEDDFSNSSGWSGSTTSGWQTSNTPAGWTAYKVPAGSSVAAVAGGQNGTPAMRWGYQYGSGVGQTSSMAMAKHLTGNKNTGYDELYIRLALKFDNNYRVGMGETAEDWKILRLWQYRSPTNTSEWSEDQGLRDTFWTFVSMNGRIGQTWRLNANVNTFQDSHHELMRLHWYGNNGYVPTSTNGNFGSITEWNYNHSTGYFNCYPNCNQGWHNVEFHIKLSTIDQPGNGVFEVWLDGKKQISPTNIQNEGGASGWTALSTKKYKGGINWIQIFDNKQYWTEGWSSPRYVYLDSIVVSTSYIGPNYVVGNGVPQDTMPPAPPSNLN